ncbi:MAG: iron ABC transporter permease [Rhodospirillales bacterium]|jgi:iron(III) transport system permease protein|nr:iron ABC transporter permease [Rhodospirillales bacterium]MBT4006991.1 iron ABC transporter permease [Rhodospirillales bacterium]MBT5076030.1 iron ABC transporter permease [Rhodospirillales bacterium]MBT5112851.1 iron ABC transporter permease [Rhodospirillales bacterium]MBT5673622.1 iron ABC transporter permease [Rhodospirillales bacterium]
MNRWTVITIAIAALFAVPVLVILAHIFVPAGDVWKHLASTLLASYVTNSLLLMIGVGTGTLIIGVGTAWLVTMCRFPGAKLFEWCLLLPMAMPAYVIAYTYTGLLDAAGPVQETIRALSGLEIGQYWFPEIRNLPGAMTMMTLVLYPYVYLLSRAAFLEQSICVLEVSRTLGRTPWQGFRSVALPLARPAIATGVVLALMETLNDFGTVQYFAVDTFTTGIFRTWYGLGEPAAAAQLAAMLMIFVLLLILGERLSRGQGRTHHTTQRYRSISGYQLRGLRKGLAITACILPVLLGFFIPAGTLLSWSLETADTMVDRHFFELAFNSFTLAATAAVLAAAIATVMAYGLRLRPTPLTKAAARLASMGYAIPGAVIAVGILIPFSWLDGTINDWSRATLNVEPGLIFSGTIVAVIFAYLVRFLAVSFNAVEASLAKITPNMDDAARTLGKKPGQILLRTHFPIMSGTLLTAGLLVFVDVMKELPATLILRPFNFDTLAIRTYQLASDERLADASSAALAIVVVGIIPVVLLSLAIARSRPGSSRIGSPTESRE